MLSAAKEKTILVVVVAWKQQRIYVRCILPNQDMKSSWEGESSSRLHNRCRCRSGRMNHKPESKLRLTDPPYDALSLFLYVKIISVLSRGWDDERRWGSQCVTYRELPLCYSEIIWSWGNRRRVSRLLRRSSYVTLCMYSNKSIDINLSIWGRESRGSIAFVWIRDRSSTFWWIFFPILQPWIEK